MLVTLEWKEPRADRHRGQVEERDYSTDKVIIDTWVDLGWCEITFQRHDPTAKAVDYSPENRAMSSAPRKRGRPRKKQIEDAEE